MCAFKRRQTESLRSAIEAQAVHLSSASKGKTKAISSGKLAQGNLSIISRAPRHDSGSPKKDNHTRGGSIRGAHDEKSVAVRFGWRRIGPTDFLNQLLGNARSNSDNWIFSVVTSSSICQDCDATRVLLGDQDICRGFVMAGIGTCNFPANLQTGAPKPGNSIRIEIFCFCESRTLKPRNNIGILSP
jgi:hypothetical protein